MERLAELCEALPEDRRRAGEGLIHRAAFLRITLEDLEEDINENGTTEEWRNGPDLPPMSRIRAAAQQHNTMVKNYAQVMRQLMELLPDTKPTGSKGEEEVNPAEKMMKQAIQNSRSNIRAIS